MFSLRSMNKKAPAIKSGKKKAKMTTLDLENDDTDGEGEGDEGVEDGEKAAMAELDAQYRTCIKCGTAHLCKIDRAGNHVHLSFNQRRAWAVSLVRQSVVPCDGYLICCSQACGTLKVTKMTPPQGGLFQMFHKNDSAPATAQAAYPQPQWYPPPSGYGVPGYPGYPQPPLLPQFAPPLPPPVPPMMSSDPVEEDGITYPSITAFIEALITKAPQRHGLREVSETLDALRFYQIDEITALTTEELGSDKFGNIVLGDAQYLLKQVGSEVKRLEKLARRARR
jgi:hypothetical protein